jgi:hypothetical protein
VVPLTPLTTKNSDLKVEYFGKFEFTIETALTRESGAQVELFDDKKPSGQKSRDRVPLM